MRSDRARDRAPALSSSSMNSLVDAFRCSASRSTPGRRWTPATPIRSARVPRSMVPPDRASIRRCRYNGRWSAYLPTSTCAMAPSVGGPPSIKVAGAGAIVLEPMAHNGSPLCLNRRPLGSNQWRRNGRPHQWLALADTIFAGAAGICRAHGDNHAPLRRHDVQPLGAVVTPKACFQHDADLVQSSLLRRRHRRSDRRPSGSNRWRHDGQPRSMATPSDDGDAAAAEHREEGVACRSLQRASGQAAVGLHVPDHRLDSASSSQQFRDRPGDAAPGAADEDLHGLDAMAAVAPINEGHVRAPVGQDFHLFQRLVQCVAVVRVARQRPHADDEATFGGRGDGDLRAES